MLYSFTLIRYPQLNTFTTYYFCSVVNTVFLAQTVVLFLKKTKMCWHSLIQLSNSLQQPMGTNSAALLCKLWSLALVCENNCDDPAVQMMWHFSGFYNLRPKFNWFVASRNKYPFLDINETVKVWKVLNVRGKTPLYVLVKIPFGMSLDI